MIVFAEHLVAVSGQAATTQKTVRKKSKTLIQDEFSIPLNLSLAKAYGFNGALLLQQLHYWLTKSQHEHGGRKWVYNTLEAWAKQLDCSASTIQRTFKSLQADGVVLVANYHHNKWDQTRWYSVDCEVLAQRLHDKLGKLYLTPLPSQHDAHMEGGEMLDSTNTKKTTKMSTETPNVAVPATIHHANSVGKGGRGKRQLSSGEQQETPEAAIKPVTPAHPNVGSLLPHHDIAGQMLAESEEAANCPTPATPLVGQKILEEPIAEMPIADPAPDPGPSDEKIAANLKFFNELAANALGGGRHD